MILTTLCVLATLFAAFPAVLVLRNLAPFYRTPAHPPRESPTVRCSVLIPARNEELGIETAVTSVLANVGVVLEVIVLDDQSTDRTAARVRALARKDPRVRLVEGRPLPQGWCGKQHACQQLAELANYDWLVFLDADVRLAPTALGRIFAHLERQRVDLLSGFPRQQTGTLFERLLIPLMQFILLGFLPFRRMRSSSHPAYAAGCGQLMVTHRTAYRASGGHAAIRRSLHDGVQLPRLYRRAGLSSDVFDASDIATCRMYRSAREVWSGLAKNATEGLATPALILPATVILGLGQIAPAPLLVAALAAHSLPLIALSTFALIFSYLPRLITAVRFRQSQLGALLHPLSMTLFLAIQWTALVRELLHLPVTWRGRSLPTAE